MSRRIVVKAAVAAVVIAMLPASSAWASTHSSAPRAAVHATAITPNGSWTTYHMNDARTGYDASAPAITSVSTTPGWTMPALDDNVYAELLVFNGVVYAATLSGTVYALNQTDGSIVWSKSLGTPQTAGWTCGNISSTGILGTPATDTAANRLYAVSEIVVGTSTTYHLFGLDLANNGNIVLNTTLTTPGFDWRIEQERGALAVRNGYVYVPFGGRAGDCGN